MDGKTLHIGYKINLNSYCFASLAMARSFLTPPVSLALDSGSGMGFQASEQEVRSTCIYYIFQKDLLTIYSVIVQRTDRNVCWPAFWGIACHSPEAPIHACTCKGLRASGCWSLPLYFLSLYIFFYMITIERF